LKRSYAAQWLLTLSLIAAGLGWVLGGDGLFRRAFRPPRSVPEKARDAEAFVAVLFPRIVPNRTPFAMSIGELKGVLGRLSREGFVSVGVRDVEDFYLKGRKLPPKAVLLAFSHDDPRVTGLADAALRRYRMRGVYFLSRTSKGGRREERRLLTRHHLRRLTRSGAWDLGWQQQASPESVPEMASSRVLLDADGQSSQPKDPGRYTLRFEGSEQGYNDAGTPRRALRILALRPNLDPRDAARVVANSFPRRGEFSDDFSKPLDADWIASWGIVSASPKRLVLLPQPKQTGAGMFLRGTETWRDVIVEFEIKKYQTEFWAYLRHKDDGSFLRVGARGGWWYVEQKTGAKALPSVLARASMPETLPARVRIVLKDDTALVHVNGRMQFGHAIRISPKVSAGRVLISVYNEKPRSALAVLGWVRARPVPERWLALPPALDERRLDELREEAVGSRTFAPRWVLVADDGQVRVTAAQESLVRALAGYYSCRLVPMADLPLLGSDPARAERMAAGLAEAAASLDASGLNVRLRREDASSPNAERVLVKLRERLRHGKRRLYVTVDDASDLPGKAARAVDGVLTPSSARGLGFEVLEAADDLKPHGA
jgi:hypothetical protein